MAGTDGSRKVTSNLSSHIFNADRKYVESGRWKCKESPTGAHHWVELESGKFTCKYCLESRVITVAYSWLVDNVEEK